MKTQSVEVRLLGQKISLKSSGDPEQVREVVKLVEDRIRDAEKKTKTPHLVALLALMDLAEEYVSARRITGEHHQQIAEKTQELFSLMDPEQQ